MKGVWARAARDDRRRITVSLAERNKAAVVWWMARALLAAADSLVTRPEKGRVTSCQRRWAASSVPAETNDSRPGLSMRSDPDEDRGGDPALA